MDRFLLLLATRCLWVVFFFFFCLKWQMPLLEVDLGLACLEARNVTDAPQFGAPRSGDLPVPSR